VEKKGYIYFFRYKMVYRNILEPISTFQCVPDIMFHLYLELLQG